MPIFANVTLACILVANSYKFHTICLIFYNILGFRSFVKLIECISK